MKNNKFSKKEGFIPFDELAPKKKRFTKKQIIKYTLIVLALIICFAVEYLPKNHNWNDISKQVNVNQNIIEGENKFYVHYIDVGQADCELLKCGDDTVLIDTGDVDGFEAISSYLDSQNVKTLDYLILTHMHADHMGSAAKVIEKYKPKNIIMTKLTKEAMPTTNLYRELLETLSKSDAKIIAAKPRESYKLENFGFVILAPNEDYNDLNNTSVVVKAYFGDTTYLFQGDAETKSENDILSNGFNVKSDVIKLGHHGSKTSSSNKYLDAVDPQIAVICCGKNNKYKHPNDETLDKLNERKIKYYRTDKNGNIVIVSNGKNVSAETER